MSTLTELKLHRWNSWRSKSVDWKTNTIGLLVRKGRPRWWRRVHRMLDSPVATVDVLPARSGGGRETADRPETWRRPLASGLVDCILEVKK